ncbi:MAG: sigma-E processing peptidase SpoIIGA [Oscillospiraceae bacterium]
MVLLKIYIDTLIITNAVITLIYIQCICKITHISISRIRILLSSAIGGISSLILLINISGFIISSVITIAKLLIIAVITFSAFNYRKLKDAVKYIFLYFLMDIIFSGICFLIWQTTGTKIIYVRNFTVYVNISLLQMIAAVIFIYIIISIYEWLTRVKFSKTESYKAVYSVGNYSIELKAVADSGNKLCDSFTGMPVVIFSSDELYDHYNLDNDNCYIQSGFRLTPYSTINGSGLIAVTSKGNVTIIDSKKNTKNIKCCIGITRSNSQKAKAIFNPSLLL